MALLRRVVGDLHEPLNDSADYMLDSIHANFEVEGRRAKWAPLAKFTVKDRLASGFPGEHPILQRTGRLKDSIQKRVFRHIARVGTGLGYANILHYGGIKVSATGATVKIPARPFVMFQPEDPSIIAHIFSKYINNKMGFR